MAQNEQDEEGVQGVVDSILKAEKLFVEVYFIKRNADSALFAEVASFNKKAKENLKVALLKGYSSLNFADQELLSLSKDDIDHGNIYKYDFETRSSEVDFFLNFKTPEVGLGQEESGEPVYSHQNKIDKNTDDCDMNGLFGFLIMLGDYEDDTNKKIGLFQKYYPVLLIKPDGLLYWIKDEFKPYDGESLLRLTEKVDFLLVDGEMYLTNADSAVKYLQVEEIFKSKAQNVLGWLKEKELISDPSVIEDFITDYSLVKKLAKISITSPVLNGEVELEKAFAYVDDNPDMYKYLKTTKENNKTQFVVNSNKAKVELVKLLDDCYLVSGLTNNRYDVGRKKLLSKS